MNDMSEKEAGVLINEVLSIFRELHRRMDMVRIDNKRYKITSRDMGAIGYKLPTKVRELERTVETYKLNETCDNTPEVGE